jgi:hypothetical protein
VRVVQAGVVALRAPAPEQRARQEVELADAHALGRAVRLEVDGVLEIGIVGAELPFEKGAGEAALEPALGFRNGERQRGVERERQRLIALHAAIKRVEQPVRLAESERRRRNDVLARALEDAGERAVEIGDVLRPGMAGSRWEMLILAQRYACASRDRRRRLGLSCAWAGAGVCIPWGRPRRAANRGDRVMRVRVPVAARPAASCGVPHSRDAFFDTPEARFSTI